MSKSKPSDKFKRLEKEYRKVRKIIIEYTLESEEILSHHNIKYKILEIYELD